MSYQDIAQKLISNVESDNGSRQGSYLKRLTERWRNDLLAQLEEGVKEMLADGCTFTQEEIELMAMGDQDEAASQLSHYRGYSQANSALNTIFDPEREMVVPRETR